MTQALLALASLAAIGIAGALGYHTRPGRERHLAAFAAVGLIVTGLGGLGLLAPTLAPVETLVCLVAAGVGGAALAGMLSRRPEASP